MAKQKRIGEAFRGGIGTLGQNLKWKTHQPGSSEEVGYMVSRRGNESHGRM